MESKELKKLNRAELLELLLEVSKENEELKAELKRKNLLLKSKRLQIEEAGSIAQAALQLNGVFDKAQKAADQYLANIAWIEKQKREELKKLRERAGEEDEP